MESGKDPVTISEIRLMHFEDGGRSHEPRNTGGFWMLLKAKKNMLPNPEEIQVGLDLNFSAL